MTFCIEQWNEQEAKLRAKDEQIAALKAQLAELTAIVVGIETERDQYRAALARLQAAR